MRDMVGRMGDDMVGFVGDMLGSMGDMSGSTGDMVGFMRDDIVGFMGDMLGSMGDNMVDFIGDDMVGVMADNMVGVMGDDMVVARTITNTGSVSHAISSIRRSLDIGTEDGGEIGCNGGVCHEVTSGAGTPSG